VFYLGRRILLKES